MPTWANAVAGIYGCGLLYQSLFQNSTRQQTTTVDYKCLINGFFLTRFASLRHNSNSLDYDREEKEIHGHHCIENETMMQMQENEIVLYQPNDTIHLEVRLEEDTVWLNRNQMAILFGRDVKTIGKHINNALREELQGVATVANFAIVQNEGGRSVVRMVEFYNLDMILSVGYRVKSSQGILFRQWANTVLKEYLLKGYSINQRFERLEHRMSHAEEKIDFFVRTALPPIEGIFYDGQIFDAYTFVSDLVRSAKSRIILFDNYVDDTVLTLLDKRSNGVSAQIYTRSITQQLALDLQRHNAQYQPIAIDEFHNAHDRFLCIDDTVYHIGALLKDLGKKWFAFNRMEIGAEGLRGKMGCDTLFIGE